MRSMSLTLLHCVWSHFPEGSASLSMMMAIAEAGSEQGNCYVSISTLASASRISRSQANRALKHLREERWVVTNRVLGQGQKHIIQLNLPKLARSSRPGYRPEASVLGKTPGEASTEAELIERVQLRLRAQDDTAMGGEALPASLSVPNQVPASKRSHRSPYSAAFGPVTQRSLSEDGGNDVDLA